MGMRCSIPDALSTISVANETSYRIWGMSGKVSVDMDCSDTGQRIVDLAREWIGTPYIHHQSAKGLGCDCVGLLIGVARELGKEISIKNYLSTPVGDSLLKELEKHLLAIPVPTAKPGDILVFSIGWNGVPRHVGIKSDRGLIHADERARKVVEVNLGFYERLLVGAFRWGER